MKPMHTRRTGAFARTIAIVAALLAVVTTTAFSIDLESARARGLVGEVDNGYLAIPPGAGAEGQQLVGSVNKERQAAYTDIAAKNGISVVAAGERTFEKRLPGFPAGTWIQVHGKWSKK